MIREWSARFGSIPGLGRFFGAYGLLVALACLSSQATAYAQVVGKEPAVIEVPVIGVHATIVPLADSADGSMQAPADPDTVGWYQPGAGVGTPGNALLDGHVDWDGRLRVFGWLNALQPGDEIRITDTDGRMLRYTVSWTRLYQVDNAPLDQIFAQTTDEEVTLITCGGQFDYWTRMYLSRWIVRATRSEAVN